MTPRPSGLPVGPGGQVGGDGPVGPGAPVEGAGEVDGGQVDAGQVDGGQVEGDGPAAGPGWYPDPVGIAQWRWWDGERWTPAVATAGRQWQEVPAGLEPAGGVGYGYRAAPGGGGWQGAPAGGGGGLPGVPAGGGRPGAPAGGGGGRPGARARVGGRPAAGGAAHGPVPWPTLPARALSYVLAGLVGGVLAASAAAATCLALGAQTYSPVTVVADLVALWAFLVGAAVLASRRLGSGDLGRDYWWGFRPVDAVRGAGASVVGRVVVTMVTAVILGLAQRRVSGNTQVLTHQRGHPLNLVVVGASAVIGAPIVEELFFRGLLLRSLAGRMSYGWAVLIQGAAFGMAHAQLGQDGLTAVAVVAGTATFGIVQGLFAARWRLGALMVSHALFNLVPVLLVAFGVTR